MQKLSKTFFAAADLPRNMLKQTQNKNATMGNQTFNLLIKELVEPHNKPLDYSEKIQMET